MVAEGEQAVDGETTAPDAVEFVVSIRGREVSCRLRGGRLDGDAELVRRIRRLDPRGTCRDAPSVARLVHQAVGSEVTIRSLAS